MRSVGTTSSITGALAAALLWSAALPALAGPVCNELDLRSPCIRSNDIRANIALGGSTGDARLRLRNGSGANGVDLRASNGNLTNLFSNDQDASNGLVKAWARINEDGTIEACWRCNTDLNETRRLSAGEYEVDFTPLSTDITGRPRSATIDGGASFANIRLILLGNRVGDASSVFVGSASLSGVLTDSPFVLIIY
ncbi:MAG: hypothetical protein ACREJ0_13780 [Geminicoccaceae bacterium]